jgi:hypothetical protein
MANESHLLGISPDVLTLITDSLGLADLAALAQTSKATAHHVKYSKLMVFRKMCTWKPHNCDTPFTVGSACSHAALAGNLKILQHLRAVGCEWDEKTTNNAIWGRYIHILKWARSCSPPCPLDYHACKLAIQGNDLGVLMWLRQEGCVLALDYAMDACITHKSNRLLQFLYDSGCTVDDFTMNIAAQQGDLKVVQWLHDKTNCPWNTATCARAAKGGHLHVLKFLRQNGCEWDGRTRILATRSNHYETIEYVEENGCPLEYDTDDSELDGEVSDSEESEY